MDGGRISLADDSSDQQWREESSVDTVSILVVDDDITCLAIVAAILKKFKYKVVTVKNPKDALCTLRIKGGAFDLVVSDVHMPDMNGFELQQAIAREFDLPVVLMTADDEEGVALKGLESGAAYFIMKPVCPDDLRDLRQFAAMRRRNNLTVVKETPRELRKNISDGITASASSSVNEDPADKKEPKRQPPRKEESEEKNGENSQSSAQKRPKIVWTNSLHNRFLEAIRSIGLEGAVPKKILEVMNVPGLTRENIASHLQKYRIFLRRVSDASYKIQYSSHKGLSRNFKPNGESSRTSSPSTIILNKLNKLNRGQFAPPLPNQEANSSISLSVSGQSRLLTNRVNWHKPTIGSSSLTSNQMDSLRHVYDKDHATSPNLDKFPSREDVGSSDVTLKNLTYQSNYVGYSLSNIRRGLANLPCNQLQSSSTTAVAANDNVNLDLLAQQVGGGREQLCDVADHRLQFGFGNGGESDEYALSPIFDLSAFEMSAQQALETTLPDQNESQLQQNNGGESTMNSNFYRDTAHWENFVNVPYPFDQTPNQHQSRQLTNSLGFATHSQINGALLLPTNEQQVVEGFSNSMGFGTFTQLSKTVLSPAHERNDDDFLESLLAPYGEDNSPEEST